jgi:hypothetical protein
MIHECGNCGETGIEGAACPRCDAALPNCLHCGGGDDVQPCDDCGDLVCSGCTGASRMDPDDAVCEPCADGQAVEILNAGVGS